MLPIVYRVLASARMVQLEDWFRSWVPDTVFSAGGVVEVRLRIGRLLHLILRKFVLVPLTLTFISLLLMSSSLLILLIGGSWIGF